MADIGGTNARFSLAERDEIGPIEHFKVTDFSSAADAIAAFLTRHAGGSPEAAVLGVAGPVENNRCTITNSGWMIDGSDLQTRFGFKVVHLLNDFAATAWSLPALQPSDLLPVGPQRPIAGAPMLVLGPASVQLASSQACHSQRSPKPAMRRYLRPRRRRSASSANCASALSMYL